MHERTVNTYLPSRIGVVVAALTLLLQAADVGARTIYRVGGEGMPEPELNEGDQFVPLSWADALESPFGLTEAVEIQPGFIKPEEAHPDTNLAPSYFENGFSILRGTWQRPQSMMAWQPERFSVRMIDGDSTTVYECETFRHVGNLCGGFDYAYKFNLGKQIYLDRIRFYAEEKSRQVIPRFIIGSNDGNQLLDGTRDYLPPGQPFAETLDFDVLHDGPGGEVTEIRFDPTPTKQLLFHVFRNLDGGNARVTRETSGGQQNEVSLEDIDGGSVRSDWEIVEFEFFATGFAPVARYTSPVIDLGEEVSIGPLSWSGEQPDETLVELRMRSGTDGDPNIYWRNTFRGFEQVTWAESGAPLTRSAYEKMELAQMGDTTHDLDNWDSWSASYDFGALQGPSAAAGPRTHAQLDVTFESAPSAGGRINYVQFATSPRLVTNVVAEIDPPAASPDEITAFTYLVQPQLEPGERGFDGVVVDTDARVVAVDHVAITSPTGTDTLAQDAEWEITRLDASGFAIRLTEPIDSADESFNIVQVGFRAQIYAYDTLFSGSLTHSEIPLEIPQPVVEGDADELADGNTLRVALSTIPKEPIQSMSLSSPVFTPNGDGLNDEVMVEYELLNLSGGTPTTLGVFDLSGRKVGEAFSDDGMISGRSEFAWDGTDGRGSLLPPGLYILQLEVGADDGDDQVQRLVSLVY